MCEGASEMMMYMLDIILLNGSSKIYCLCRYILSYVLDIDNSDSPSIVEQLPEGPSLVYNIFISDSFLALDLSYALCLVPSFLQHG